MPVESVADKFAVYVAVAAVPVGCVCAVQCVGCCGAFAAALERCCG